MSATKGRLRAAVAEEVRVALVRRRKSATSLAAELGWSQGYIAHRLSGRQPFDVDDLEALADALDLEVVDLLATPTVGRHRGTREYAPAPVPTQRRPAGGRPANRTDSSGPPSGPHRAIRTGRPPT